MPGWKMLGNWYWCPSTSSSLLGSCLGSRQGDSPDAWVSIRGRGWALGLLSPTASLVYRLPQSWVGPRLPWKSGHAAMHLLAFLLMVLGLHAVFEFHNHAKIPNLYSLHSWLGITTVFLFTCQVGTLCPPWVLIGCPLQLGLPWHQHQISLLLSAWRRCGRAHAIGSAVWGALGGWWFSHSPCSALTPHTTHCGPGALWASSITVRTRLTLSHLFHYPFLWIRSNSRSSTHILILALYELGVLWARIGREQRQTRMAGFAGGWGVARHLM